VLVVTWPDWWDWEIELTPHLQKRMERSRLQRGRPPAHVERARGHRADIVEGRVVIETERKRARWEVIIFWWS